MRVLFHAIAVIAAGVAGAAVAVSAVAVHRSVVLGLPLGLLLAVATTFVTVWAMRELLPRLTTAFAVGWIIAFGFVIAGKREGDYAVAGDLRGFGLMALALAVAAVGVASIQPRHSRSGPGAT